MKVLHLPTTVGGNPQGISKHLKILGVNSQSWALRQNYLSYPADKVLWKETDSLIYRELKRLWALRYVFLSFDAIHFNYGTTLFIQVPFVPSGSKIRNLLGRTYSSYLSFFQLLELNILKWRKIPLFVQYQGDDARQGDYCLKNFNITAATEVGDDYYNPRTDNFKRKQIQRIARYCQKIYALNPDLLYVLPPHAEFLPYSHISFEEWSPKFTQMLDRPLKIGHAPSHRKGKGTEYLIKALDSLKEKGYNFELVLVEGVSNAEAKILYEDIDVLVDQLFFGWYGGLAVEAMALGKPVLVYLREDDLDFIPAEMKAELPVINVNPFTIEEELKRVLEMDREKLRVLGQCSRAFVMKWHNPLTIASRLKHDYENASR